MNAKIPHKILFVEAGKGYGGSSGFLYSLLDNIDREKFEPIVALYLRGSGLPLQKIMELGIEVIILNEEKSDEQSQEEKRKSKNLNAYLKLLKKSLIGLFMRLFNTTTKIVIEDILDTTEIRNILRVIRQKKIELIVLNNDVRYHISSIIAARMAHIPCICRKAGVSDKRKIERVMGRYVDAYIAISESAAKNLVENKIPTKNLSLIYAGVDTKKYDPELWNSNEILRELQIPNGKKIVGSIARIDEGKGHFDLIKAALIVVKQYSNVIFLIVGNGGDPNGRYLEQQLHKQVFELDIQENVIFSGWRDDVPKILSAIDIFVQNPTYPEGLCISCLEAMAMAKPTVVTAAGGLAETTVDKVTGFVVPPGQPELLANAIIKLLKDRDLAIAMGANARKRVRETFDIEKNAAKMTDIFLKLL